MLCPRRGGAFKPTNDSRWAHALCGRNAPGQTRVSQAGVVEIRLIPKECKKVKCGVCNRQQGACVRCAHIGCTSFFHPMCVERGGKGCVRNRRGEKEVFCQEHVPVGIERWDGHLIDAADVRRLRLSLDRSRIILDTLLRREKLKLRLCKVEGEHFSSSFYRILDRAMGRKPDNPEMAVIDESGTWHLHTVIARHLSLHDYFTLNLGLHYFGMYQILNTGKRTLGTMMMLEMKTLLKKLALQTSQ